LNLEETKICRLTVYYSFNSIDLEIHLVSCLDNNFGYHPIQEYRVSQSQLQSKSHVIHWGI